MKSRDCDICGALVPASMMVFHRDWHAHLEGRGQRFWEMSSLAPASETRHVRTVPAISPPVTARPEFVSDLRSRLMAEATSKASAARPAADGAIAN
jgi:hypothetical protein